MSTQEIISVLETVLHILKTTEVNLMWSHYNSPQKVVEELEAHRQLLRDGDLSRISDLELLFAPTGSLQDISIDSGWGRKFLEVAARFDNALGKDS